MRSRKAQLSALMPMAIALVTIAVALVVGFLILAEVKSQAATQEGIVCNATSGGLACNGTGAVQSAMDDIPGWLPIIVITMIGAILLGMVRFFRG